MRPRFAAVAAVLLLAGPAVAAPGDPRVMRGTLEWPGSLSAEPIAVIRGDDGRLYYADVSTAQRIGAGPIFGRVSVFGVEGTRPHEIAAVAIGAGDSAVAALSTPPAPPYAVLMPPTMPLPAAPQPSASLPYTPPPALPAASAPAQSDDLWQLPGKVKAVTGREMVIETTQGETVRVDVGKLSQWTRDTVRPGDQIKLFGIAQKDRRLVASGFIQVMPAAPAASPFGTSAPPMTR
jgi:hypothetical protein